ncbi:MAG: hypothetical protein M5R36_14345 [Deltaproteobacteria bacterium]|nr:hypothetical protein [Deltaproteobacteria bacterium]
MTHFGDLYSLPLEGDGPVPAVTVTQDADSNPHVFMLDARRGDLLHYWMDPD